MSTDDDGADPGTLRATLHRVAGSAGAIGGIIFNRIIGKLTSASNYAAVFAVFATLQPLAVSALWLWMRSRRDVDAEKQVA